MNKNTRKESTTSTTLTSRISAFQLFEVVFAGVVAEMVDWMQMQPKRLLILSLRK